mmetsp:Transcript_56889/g.133953  ORF Transcript_56889/g.133953 Transcript_56889/m.133953 type:complete len:219 (-) Transcript_56889:33-689(-)
MDMPAMSGDGEREMSLGERETTLRGVMTLRGCAASASEATSEMPVDVSSSRSTDTDIPRFSSSKSSPSELAALPFCSSSSLSSSFCASKLSSHSAAVSSEPMTVRSLLRCPTESAGCTSLLPAGFWSSHSLDTASSPDTLRERSSSISSNKSSQSWFDSSSRGSLSSLSINAGDLPSRSRILVSARIASNDACAAETSFAFCIFCAILVRLLSNLQSH